MERTNLDVKQTNEMLEERLSTLKRCSDITQVRNIVNELNEMLYSAIIYHAGEVNAVKIKTNADVIIDNLINPNLEGREKWKKYLELSLDKENIQGNVEFTFTAHLPYAFSTGTHGSGQRNAMSASVENIIFEVIGPNKSIAARIGIDIGSGSSLSFDKCFFQPWEICQISLTEVDDCEFSQEYEGKNKPLARPQSALAHYLFYRGFGKRRIKKEDIPKSKWKRKFFPLLKDTFITYCDSKLFEVNLEKNQISGFAAFEKESEIELYEFESLELPSEFVKKYFLSDESIYAAYAIALNREKNQDNIKVYKGKNAILRLHEVKTERRF